MKRFLKIWLVLTVAYLATVLAISWIVSGSVVYPTETLAHVLIVPFLQAVLVVLILRSPKSKT